MAELSQHDKNLITKTINMREVCITKCDKYTQGCKLKPDACDGPFPEKENVMSNNSLMIAGVEVHTDNEGRFNLNALHRASGEGQRKRPSKWLATDPAKDLIAEMSQSLSGALGGNPINSMRGGNVSGTFAHQLLAISYAGWINPKFQILVNQTFLDLKSGKLVAQSPAIDPNDPAALRQILIGYTEKVIEQKAKIEADAPKVEAHDRIIESGDAMLVREAAKILDVGPCYLFRKLRSMRWIMTKTNVPLQDKINAGLLDYKYSSHDDPKTGFHETRTPLVTAKGLTALSKKLGRPLSNEFMQGELL